MATRLGLVLLLVALAFSVVANAYPTFDSALGISINGGLAADGTVGELIDQADEMMMESESTRRTLANYQSEKYISYEVLKKDQIPCNRGGASYYSCSAHEAVNPYTRGCTRITQCARNTR